MEKWQGETSTTLIKGATKEDCLRQAEADANEGHANGFVVDREYWGQEGGLRTLSVAYRRRGTQAAPVSAAPASAPPVSYWQARAPSSGDTALSRAKVAGVLWIVSAALIGALALQQWNAADLVDNLRRLSQSLGVTTAPLVDIRTTAVVNAVQAVLVAILGIRLLQAPSQGLARWSLIAAVLSVIAGIIQPNALANASFLGSIVAAIAAGVLTWTARAELG